jgi:hypothetical protein
MVSPHLATTSLTTYRVEEAEMSGGRSEASGTVFEERRQEVFAIPPPPVPLEIIQDTKIVENRSPSPARSHYSHGPLIVNESRPREESTFIERRKETEYVERSDEIPVGPLALAITSDRSRSKDERAIRAEIKALEAEKEALRAERKASKEVRRAERIRREGRESGDLVLYEERMEVKREREPEGGVRIEKDRKGRMSISVPKYR